MTTCHGTWQHFDTATPLATQNRQYGYTSTTPSYSGESKLITEKLPLHLYTLYDLIPTGILKLKVAPNWASNPAYPERGYTVPRPLLSFSTGEPTNNKTRNPRHRPK